MTRRSSVRANAREIYRDLALAKAATPTPDPPSLRFGGQVSKPAIASAAAGDPSPQEPATGRAAPAARPGGGGEQKEGGGENSLTAQVRALYEDSAVPVREIAALAGVTERTIYKYAAKQRWKRRYRFAPRGNYQDLAAAAANRGRRLRPTPGFAPEKGAGGRFIRREDKGLPFAQGLKATDPAGAQRAAADCRQAKRLSREAQAEAERQRRAEACIQAMDWTCRASEQLRHYLEARDKQPKKQNKQRHPRRPAPDNDPIERVYRLSLTMALDRWEALQAEEKRQISRSARARPMPQAVNAHQGER